MRKCSTILALLFVVQPVMADDTVGTEKVLKNTVNSVLAILRAENLNKEEKRGRIEKVINPVFDFPLMAKLALGRKHWPRLNKEEKKEFAGIFIGRLKDSYLEKIGLFTNEKVEFRSAVKVKKKIHVPTVVISKGEEYSILYKLHKSNDGWRIYDFEVQGVSMISTYRSQYNEHFTNNGTVSDLLEKMKKRDRAE